MRTVKLIPAVVALSTIVGIGAAGTADAQPAHHSSTSSSTSSTATSGRAVPFRSLFWPGSGIQIILTTPGGAAA